MKLTYWIAECLRDSSAYNVRAKTRREVVALLQADRNPADYAAPRKVTVEYRDALDLVRECLNEGGAYWEESPAEAPLANACTACGVPMTDWQGRYVRANGTTICLECATLYDPPSEGAAA